MKKGYVTYKDKYNAKYGYKKNESHTLEEISKDTGVSMKGLQQIYNKGIGAYKTNPTSVRPNVKSKEQWAMARVNSFLTGGKTTKMHDKALYKSAKANLKDKKYDFIIIFSSLKVAIFMVARILTKIKFFYRNGVKIPSVISNRF